MDRTAHATPAGGADPRRQRPGARATCAALAAAALLCACAGPAQRQGAPAVPAAPAAPGGVPGTPAPGAPAAPGAVPDNAARSGPVEPPALGLFSHIRVPDRHVAVLQLAAHGAQVFRCEAHDGGHFAWVFRQPDAELRDLKGQPAGRHGANFSFEVADGSRLIGHVVGHDGGDKPGDLPWLLLATDSYGDGQLAGIDYVQRINTRGGVPPNACLPAQDQQVLRVDFSADFVFYRPQ